MISIKMCLVWLLVACGLPSVIQADDCSPEKPQQFSLGQEFQIIHNLAPHSSVIALIQNHMNNDIRFRKAVQYMLSPQFANTLADIDVSATYQGILRKFIRAGVNTTDIDGIGKIFNYFIIPDIQEATGMKSDFRSASLVNRGVQTRSLDSFLNEVSQLIPQEELINTLKEQVATNEQFAKFYNIMRKSSFRSKVMQSFYNSDVARAIKTLRRYQIDLRKMTEYAFNLFSNGPAP